MTYPQLLAHFRARLPDLLAEIRELAEHESPSHDRPALEALAGRLGRRIVALGGQLTEVANLGGGANHVLGLFRADNDLPPALILAHFDTVWPVGTLERMPVQEREGRLYGPGVFDMKANLVVAFAVLEAFAALGLRPPRPVKLLLTSDEEVGSPGSRHAIEEHAAAAAYVLVPEPPLADGGLKTSRKGVGRFTVTVQGRAAHAGVAPEKGASAIVELAHQVLRLQALNDPPAGTTVNVGTVRGGTTVNVVPAEAVAHVDVRVTTQEAALAVELAIRGLTPVTPGTSLTVDGHFNRPPMERTPAIAALFERARTAARGSGLELTEGSTGGGSDGNFTAALGVATLDGLGIRGGGAHADDEHIVIESIPERAALIALLLMEL